MKTGMKGNRCVHQIYETHAVLFTVDLGGTQLTKVASFTRQRRSLVKQNFDSEYTGYKSGHIQNFEMVVNHQRTKLLVLKLGLVVCGKMLPTV